MTNPMILMYMSRVSGLNKRFESGLLRERGHVQG